MRTFVLLRRTFVVEQGACVNFEFVCWDCVVWGKPTGFWS
uniref:Uncharacterized protein n=1 Tax=Streptomyces clavuligerus TaxID=1901 RepID=Q6TMT7_STRCL|nr:hypothetical protein pSCL2.4.H9.5c [Streptomyces clavuligerus]